MSRLVLVALAAFASSPLVAQVPPDAAVFVHVKVAKLWAGPIGESLRAAKVSDIGSALEEFEAVTGLTPADISSASVYFRDQSRPDYYQFAPCVVRMVLTKPIDAGRLVAVAAVLCRASDGRAAYRFEKGVLTVRRLAYTFPKNGPVAKNEVISLDMSDPLRPRLFVLLPATPAAAQAAGPLTPLVLAAPTKDFVIGVNAARLNQRERFNIITRVSPELRPLVPLLEAELITAVGEVAGGELTIEARFRSANAAVAKDCEKALKAWRALLSARLAAGQAGWSKEAKGGPVAAVLEGLKPGVDAATTRLDGPDAVGTLTVRTDLPLGPALAAAVDKADADARSRVVVQSNLKQIAIALHSHHDAQGVLPPPAYTGENDKPLLSWRVRVLLYTDYDKLARAFHMDEPWSSKHNLKVLQDNPMPALYALPGVTKEGDKETYYRVFVGEGAAFEPLKSLKFSSFTDGVSNTVLVATAATSVPWTKPDELAFDPKAPAADLKKLLRLDGVGSEVLLGDGTTRTLRSTIDAATLRGLVTRAGGEVPDLD